MGKNLQLCFIINYYINVLLVSKPGISKGRQITDKPDLVSQEVLVQYVSAYTRLGPNKLNESTKHEIEEYFKESTRKPTIVWYNFFPKKMNERSRLGMGD